MKKYSFLVYHKEYIDFLKGIQELGVLHVIEKGSAEIADEELREKYLQVNELGNSIKFLSKIQIEDPADNKGGDALTILSELKKLQSDSESYHQRLTQLIKEKSALEPWGDFSWDTMSKLKDAGYYLDFFMTSARTFDEAWKEKYDIEIINEAGGTVYFVILRKEGPTTDLNAELVKLPEISLSKANNSIEEIEAIIDKTEEIYKSFASEYLSLLEATKEKISRELEFEKVVLTTPQEADNKLRILEGWVPKDVEENVNEFLNKSGIYYEASKPEPGEGPPIKLKNNKFARLFESIGELYTFPNYKEIDLTVFFAPFYMLFFGFCLGDIGYGLLIVAATIYGVFKVKPSLKPLMKLGMFLGISTVLMGTVGGTLFGINLIETGYTLSNNSIAILKTELPSEVSGKLIALQDKHFKKKDEFLKAVSTDVGKDETKVFEKEILRSAESDYPVLNSIRHMMLDSNKLMILSLILGYIQVLFGMFLKAANRIRMFGFKYSISQFGWIVIVMIALPSFGLGYMDVIPAEIANKIFLYTLIAGAIPALFYNSPGKNPLLNFGTGLWETYQTASGLLGDILSYIRLFALGLSSAILGSVFNELAFELSPDMIIVRQLVIILILAFGHSLNFFMAALGSFVHPLRLTFVEFYKNADFMGGGRQYDPLKN